MLFHKIRWLAGTLCPTLTFTSIADKFLFIIGKIKINNQITAPELRVLDDRGNNLGVMKKDAALALAKQKGLDLIEISPNAKPPVARIMSFDKFRYQQEKKEKKQKTKQKGGELKQIQISLREARYDLQRKAEKIEDFLKEGNRVEIVLVLRGREKQNKDFARQKLNEFLAMLNPEAFRVTMEPRVGGYGIVTQIAKK